MGSFTRIARQLCFFLLTGNLSAVYAQVLVHEEPMHHVVFNNESIRILNVLLPPGDTTQYHIHHTPSVFIFFTGTRTGSQLDGSGPVTTESQVGRLLFENLAEPNTRTHRVWNADRDTFHVMDIELLFKDTGFVQDPLTIPGLKLMIDTSWVRAYQFSLLKGKDFILMNEKNGGILVSLNASTIQTNQSENDGTQRLKTGDFLHLKRNHSFSLKNLGEGSAEFVLLELPIQ
jgi:quercetin dioxygenase-like cupin family protein